MSTTTDEDEPMMAAKHVTMMWREDARVDLQSNRFPHAIVWGPLGPLTCCCPVVGHMGIGDSEGRIHDFAGPYCIGVDEFMVGCVWRYAVVSSPADAGWDRAIERADEEYRSRVHDICCARSSSAARARSLARSRARRRVPQATTATTTPRSRSRPRGGRSGDALDS